MPAVENQAIKDQILSMFLQFVEAWEMGKMDKPNIKYSQVAGIPAELLDAVRASKTEWQEIAVAEAFGGESISLC